MLLGFKKRFESFVEEGSKTHTLRAKRTIRPKVGETCHCYVNPRQKSMRLLGRFPCVRIQDVTIREVPLCGGLVIWIDDARLSLDEANEFAWRDGFRENGVEGALELMYQFWRKNHTLGSQPWMGDLIHWQYLPRTAKRKGRK